MRHTLIYSNRRPTTGPGIMATFEGGPNLTPNDCAAIKSSRQKGESVVRYRKGCPQRHRASPHDYANLEFGHAVRQEVGVTGPSNPHQ